MKGLQCSSWEGWGSLSRWPLLALGAFLPFQRHIAAHRQGPQGVLGALADGFPEGRAHADGKLVDPDAAELCHRKVAELMDGDHGAEHEHRSNKGDNKRHQFSLQVRSHKGAGHLVARI